MAARSASSVSRRQLAAVLGLKEGASRSALLSRAGTLCGLLEARVAALPKGSAEAEAVEAELAAVIASLADGLGALADGLEGLTDGLAVHGGTAGDERVPAAVALSRQPGTESRAGWPKRTLLLLAGALAACGLLFLAVRWWAGGAASSPVVETIEAAPRATLAISSRAPRSVLRVFDADTEQLLFKEITAEEVLSLPAGRYAAEVSREDCPDRWQKTVVLDAGETKRFEASVCEGTGELVVRSNVAGDRLLIDGLDVGSTGRTPHLIGVGEHALRVTKAGYAPFEGRVRLGRDERLEVRAELVRQTSGSKRRTAAAAEERQAEPERVAEPGDDSPSKVQKRAAPQRPASSPSPLSVADLSGGSAGAAVGAAGTSGPAPLPRPRPKRFDFDPDAVDGGSTTWHDRLRSRVLARFDADGSGRIDRLEETDSIPCSFWQQTEASFDEGGLGISMARLYGFDGSEWHPGALGFDPAQRAAAYGRMQGCGLAK